MGEKLTSKDAGLHAIVVRLTDSDLDGWLIRAKCCDGSLSLRLKSVEDTTALETAVKLSKLLGWKYSSVAEAIIPPKLDAVFVFLP